MEAESFRAHLHQEVDAVYRLAYHLAGNSDDAGEIAQETFKRALRAAPRFELRDKGMRPWLFKIAHNYFYSHMKRRNREPFASEDLGRTTASDDIAVDANDVSSQDLDDQLKEAIESLPANQRAVLLLWAVHDFKYREIAETLEIPVGTVMSRLHRARRVLEPQLRSLASEEGVIRPRRRASAPATMQAT